MYMKRFGSRLMTISLLALLPMATGCGFVFSHAPPEGHEQLDYFTCTENIGECGNDYEQTPISIQLPDAKNSRSHQSHN